MFWANFTKPIKKLEGLGSQKQCIYAGWVGPQDLLRSVPGHLSKPKSPTEMEKVTSEKQTLPAPQNPGILPQILGGTNCGWPKKNIPKNPMKPPKKKFGHGTPKTMLGRDCFLFRQMGDEFQKTSLPPFVFRAFKPRCQVATCHLQCQRGILEQDLIVFSLLLPKVDPKKRSQFWTNVI